MGAKKKSEVPKTVSFYDELVALNPAIERKGATMPYTSVNGNMFSFMSWDGYLNLRLPESELEKFLIKFETGLSVQHGRLMREYAVVPQSLLAKPNELNKYFLISFQYAQTLKSKKK